MLCATSRAAGADRIERYNEVLNIPHRIPRHSECEWSVAVADALPVLRALHDWINATHFPVGHIIGTR